MARLLVTIALLVMLVFYVGMFIHNMIVLMNIPFDDDVQLCTVSVDAFVYRVLRCSGRPHMVMGGRMFGDLCMAVACVTLIYILHGGGDDEEEEPEELAERLMCDGRQRPEEFTERLIQQPDEFTERLIQHPEEFTEKLIQHIRFAEKFTKI